MISLNVVIWDESNVIDRCLKSTRDHVDEIVLMVDTSCRFTNRLRNYTDNILTGDLAGSIVEHHRNRLIEASTEPWILVLDPDEFLGPRLGPEIDKIARAQWHSYDGFWLPRFNITYTKNYELIVGDDYPDWNLRLFKNYGRYSGVIYEDNEVLTPVENPLGLYNVGYHNKGTLFHDKTYEDIEEVKRTIALYQKYEGQQRG